ncbi:MAG: helix-turn-helix domain-containing protein [Nitrospinota bacterium]|nr:helix-turn-helix domain-containing protein [Nitrospinota bacterium]
MLEKKIGITKFLGTRLREWRKASGYKIKQLADIISISQGSLSDLENNKSLPSAETIAKLHRHTDINIFWLMLQKGSMRREPTLSLENNPAVYEEMEPYQTEAGPIDQNLKELLEMVTRVYRHGGSDKVAHLKGFLIGADPGE